MAHLEMRLSGPHLEVRLSRAQLEIQLLGPIHDLAVNLHVDWFSCRNKSMLVKISSLEVAEPIVFCNMECGYNSNRIIS